MAKYNWKKHKEQGYGYWMQTPDGGRARVTVDGDGQISVTLQAAASLDYIVTDIRMDQDGEIQLASA
jgi:hypothetical protein